MSGNSGGPIIAEDQTVLGISAFVTIPTPSAITKGTRFDEPRRFAVRLDRNITWLPVAIPEFVRSTKLLEQEDMLDAYVIMYRHYAVMNHVLGWDARTRMPSSVQSRAARAQWPDYSALRTLHYPDAETARLVDLWRQYAEQYHHMRWVLNPPVNEKDSRAIRTMDLSDQYFLDIFDHNISQLQNTHWMSQYLHEEARRWYNFHTGVKRIFHNEGFLPTRKHIPR